MRGYLLPQVPQIGPIPIKHLLIYSFVNGLLISGHFLQVFVGDKSSRVANLMDDALLYFRMRITGCNRLNEVC